MTTMKVFRWFFALFLFALGGSAILAVGYFYYYISATQQSIQQSGRGILYAVAAGFIIAGLYLCTFAIRIVLSKGPLLDSTQPNQEKKSNDYSLCLYGVLAIVIAISHPGGIWGGMVFAVQLLLIIAANSYLVIALHECGHLVAGLAVGATPHTMLIGSGKDWGSFLLGGMRVRIGRFPFRGSMFCTPGRQHWTRFRFFIFVLGGPLASLGAFAGIFWYCKRLGMSLSLTQNSLWQTACAYFFFQALIAVICFFWTAPVMIDGRLLKPDLALLLDCLFRPRTVIKDFLSVAGDYQDRLLHGKNQEAWEILKSVLPAESEHAPWMVDFSLMLDASALPQLDRLASEALERSNVPPLNRTALLLTRGTVSARLALPGEARNWFKEAFLAATTEDALIYACEHIANLVIQARLLDYLADAQEAAKMALQRRPNSITLSGTHGSILVEMGRLKEGISILEKVYLETQSEFDKVIAAFYLALAQVKSGRQEDASFWWKKMDSHRPLPWLLQRLPELVDEGKNAIIVG